VTIVRLGVPIVCQLCGTNRVVVDYAGQQYRFSLNKMDSVGLDRLSGSVWDYRKMTLNQRVAGSSPARLTIIFNYTHGGEPAETAN
jgi:hypothetical protein